MVLHPTEAVHVNQLHGALDTAVFSAILAVVQNDGFGKAKDGLVTVSRSVFRELVGREFSNKDDDIHASLNTLTKLQFKWNILGKGRARIKGTMNFLSTFIVNDAGTLSFRLNPDLVRLINFVRPQLYGRYNLLDLLALNSSFSRRIFQLVIEDYSRANESRGRDESYTTSSFDLNVLRNMLGADNAHYADFRFFKRDVLMPACREISQVSGFNVELKLTRQSRRITHVAFQLRRKVDVPQMDLNLGVSVPEDLTASFKANGIDRDAYVKFFDRFSVDDVRRVWNYVLRQHQREAKDNLTGYMVTCLKNGALREKLRHAADGLKTSDALEALERLMSKTRKVCEEEWTSRLRDVWRSLSAEEREAAWAEAVADSTGTLPLYVVADIRMEGLESYLLSERFLDEFMGSDPAIANRALNAAVLGRLSSRFEKVLPAMESLLAAHGYKTMQADWERLRAQMANGQVAA